MKRQRQYTLQERRRDHWSKSVPSLFIKGQWLTALGFEAGQKVNVECEEGKLIITPMK
jgi:formylmethanofuran dehydrogenase subunit D